MPEAQPLRLSFLFWEQMGNGEHREAYKVNSKTPLSATDFLQMAGRAGRAGLDTLGEAILMAPKDVTSEKGYQHLLKLLVVRSFACVFVSAGVHKRAVECKWKTVGRREGGCGTHTIHQCKHAHTAHPHKQCTYALPPPPTHTQACMHALSHGIMGARVLPPPHTHCWAVLDRRHKVTSRTCPNF